MKKRVLLGMSGGVDSAMSALILKKAGYELVGVTFRLWENCRKYSTAPVSDSNYLEDARRISEKHQFKHYIKDLREEFKQTVIEYYINTYISGQTPFPCVVCNQQIKWKYLFAMAEELNCDYIATGHYAQKEFVNQKWYLKEALDPDKDQSFFLWGLSQEILEKALFPLGMYSKKEVKEMAVREGFIRIAKQKESTGVCFVEESDYHSFLIKHMQERGLIVEPGVFVNKRNEIIGYHKGYPFYTIGQRRGLGINSNKALYIKNIEADKNIITLSDHSDLYQREIELRGLKLVDEERMLKKESVTVKIRYRKQETPGQLVKLDTGTYRIVLHEALDAVAPGQTAVFYENGLVLGGGFIV